MRVVISGVLLPHYYHAITTPARFMMLPASCNRRSDPCLQPSGKVIPTIRQTYPRLCPTLPKALGIYARNCRLSVPAFSGVGAHVRGHESSCTRANYAFLQNESCFFRNHHVFSFWLKIYKNTANVWCFE